MKPKKLLFGILFVLPFIIGTAGYLYSGLSLSDSTYASFVLYAVNPVNDNVNLLIIIARWTAPAALAGGFLAAIGAAWKRLRDRLTLLFPDTVRLCGDSPRIETLKGTLRHTVDESGGVRRSRRPCLIDFRDERESFAFFRRNEKKLKGRTVLIFSDSVDMFRCDSDAFRIFNPTEMIARDYWISHPLPVTKGTPPELTVVLVGSDKLCEKLLVNAVLNNVFDREQKVTYHVFGKLPLFRSVHSDLKFMTGDGIVFHDEPWRGSPDLLRDADRVVFTQSPTAEELAELKEFSKNSPVEVDCRVTDEEFVRLVGWSALRAFGNEADVMTLANITSSDVYDAAKRLNYSYACKYGAADQSGSPEAIEKEWEELDGFTRHSNIAAVDYHRIRRIISPESCVEPNAAAGELEHIRWCRFHYLYHWEYGANEAGKKDPVRKLHPCLVEYDKLKDGDKVKDIDSIRVLAEVFKNIP